jgi:hypothetical protein
MVSLKNILVHDSNVGCCEELIPCLHEQLDLISQMLIYKAIWMFRLCVGTLCPMLIVVIPFLF